MSCRHCWVMAVFQHFQQVWILQPGFLASREVLLESLCPWMGHYIFGVFVFVFQGGAALAAHGGVCPQPPPLKALGFSLRHPVQG